MYIFEKSTFYNLQVFNRWNITLVNQSKRTQLKSFTSWKPRWHISLVNSLSLSIWNYLRLQLFPELSSYIMRVRDTPTPTPYWHSINLTEAKAGELFPQIILIVNIGRG